MSTDLIKIKSMESDGLWSISAIRHGMSKQLAELAGTSPAAVRLTVSGDHRTTTISLNQKEWVTLRDAVDHGFAELRDDQANDVILPAFDRDHDSDPPKNVSNVPVERHDICAKLVFSFVIAYGSESSDSHVDEAVKVIANSANEAMAELGHASRAKFETIVLSTRDV